MTQVTSLENRIKYLQRMLVESMVNEGSKDEYAMKEIMEALNSARRKRKDIKIQRKSLSNI